LRKRRKRRQSNSLEAVKLVATVAAAIAILICFGMGISRLQDNLAASAPHAWYERSTLELPDGSGPIDYLYSRTPFTTKESCLAAFRPVAATLPYRSFCQLERSSDTQTEMMYQDIAKEERGAH
jgi:hypothetical protein